MKIEAPLIAVMVASFIFIGLFGITRDVGSKYIETGSNINFNDLGQLDLNNKTTSLYSAMNRINQSKTNVDAINDQFSKLQPNPLSLFPFLQLVFNIGKEALNSVLIVKDIVGVFSQVFGVNLGLFVSIILIVMLISVAMILAGRTYLG